MMSFVKPSEIKGSLLAPPSKSMAQRAIAAAMLCQQTSTIYNPSYCQDALSALSIAKSLGAKVKIAANKIQITGTNRLKSALLDCGESGLALRMFAPIAALYPQKIVLTGKGSLIKRPINMVEEALKQLHVLCETQQGKLPLTIWGPLRGGKAFIDGSISSQGLTGLLMSLPLAHEDSTLYVRQLKSKPYIDMTLEILKDFGVDIKHADYETFTIKGQQHYKPTDYTVEGDWSCASFMLVAGAIAGSVEIKGLKLNSTQSDIQILQALKAAKANMHIANDSILVQRSHLMSFTFDATSCPDLFPPLVALASHCKGTSEILGVERLLYKESNRAKALQAEFSKMGIAINLKKNSMYIKGAPIICSKVYAHNDHRIAMATAIAALKASGPITIKGCECIAKSYPQFFQDLKLLGALMQ